MDDQLIITIDYETAPRAGDLGKLFSALARDYKDVTEGRLLVVLSIRRGSIIATLTDLALQALPYAKDTVEIAAGVVALADFSKLLKKLIDRAKGAKPKKLLYGHRKAPQRSVEAIIKVAAKSGRAVLVRHTSSNGDTLEVEMSAAEAVRLRNAGKHRRKEKTRRSKKALGRRG